MKIDVLVGGQYGSEGKGLVASYIATQKKYDWVISVNSAQAGHTAPYFNVDGSFERMIVTRQLPSGIVNNHDANIYIGAGAVINWGVLKSEISELESVGIPIKERLFINKFATLIEDTDEEAERGCLNLVTKIGSTGEGVGSALSKRCIRQALLVKDVSTDLNLVDDSGIIGGDVLLEGSQGFGLSIYTKHYPYCTSRDTTTAAFLSFAQLSPRDVRDVYGIFRTYPIRVAGTSGYMYKELTWEQVSELSLYEKLTEITTVTKKTRRIGTWDSKLARASCRVNGINKPVLTFANYLSANIENKTTWHDVLNDIQDRIDEMAQDVGGKFNLISTSKYGGWIK